MEWRKIKFRDAVVRYINRDRIELEKGKESLSEVLANLKKETSLYFKKYLEKHIHLVLRLQRFFRLRY